jgi:guanylate kinase
MKSNISQKEIDSGTKIINLLKDSNPKLLPNLLKKFIPEYKKFSPNVNQYGLWLSSSLLKKTSQKYDKIVFLLNGLAASGKDSIYNEMIKLTPKLFFKTITATSRPPRENEINGIDYFFYKNTSKFINDIKKEEFIEYLKRGDTYYGLPKKSVRQALSQSKPVIYCQIEMSGWPKLEKYLSSLNQNLLIIKGFVLPYMTLSGYLDWLVKNRGNEGIKSRINKSGWELKIAPKNVDFFITNRINPNIPSLSYTSKTIINTLLLFINTHKIKKFTTPTDNLKPTANVEKIIKIHNSIT